MTPQPDRRWRLVALACLVLAACGEDGSTAGLLSGGGGESAHAGVSEAKAPPAAQSPSAKAPTPARPGEEDPEVAASPSRATPEAASDAEPAKADPPSARIPPLGAALLAGHVQLPPAHREQVRELHVAAGGMSLLLTDGWTEAAEGLLATLESLPSHGIGAGSSSALPPGLVDRLYDLREELLATDWTGDRDADEKRAAVLVEAELRLVRLYVALADRLGASRPLPPRTRGAVEGQLIRALATWDTPALLATLPPPFEAYEALRKALAMYRFIEASGGFVRLPEELTSVYWADAAPQSVAALRRRLAQEDGVLASIPSDDPAAMGEPFLDAVDRAYRAYQLRRGKHRKHAALKAKGSAKAKPRKKKRKGGRSRGVIREPLLHHLTVPVSERIATLELNLERLRRTELRDYDYAVFVNLPSYHGEVWDGPERLRRFRVVVGGAKLRGGRRINATPILTAFIYRVVYNPYWNVPRRIFQKEILAAARKWVAKSGEQGATEVKYLASRGYQLKGSGGLDKQWIRKPPGPNNPLGKVKILFENRHFVYLHDTNSKDKFRRTRRAFSHGCMRVHEPLELAEMLLRRDGTWHVAEQKRVMEHHRKTEIDLDHPVPIVTDYITARVNDRGRVEFLNDMYRLDREQLARR